MKWLVPTVLSILKGLFLTKAVPVVTVQPTEMEAEDVLSAETISKLGKFDPSILADPKGKVKKNYPTTINHMRDRAVRIQKAVIESPSFGESKGKGGEAEEETTQQGTT